MLIQNFKLYATGLRSQKRGLHGDRYRSSPEISRDNKDIDNKNVNQLMMFLPNIRLIILLRRTNTLQE